MKIHFNVIMTIFFVKKLIGPTKEILKFFPLGYKMRSFPGMFYNLVTLVVLESAEECRRSSLSTTIEFLQHYKQGL